MNADKVFVIGLDGMDPSLTKKYMDAEKCLMSRKLLKEALAAKI